VLSKRDARSSRPRHGFTLLELLVVLAIIATLAAVVAPSIFGNVGTAKSTAAKAQLDVFELALTQYRLDNDAFPTTEQGLAALRARPTSPGLDGEPPKNWRGPYLTRPVPLDPWGRPYLYVQPGVVTPTSYDLYSLGRDGRSGGDGEDADVTSWGSPTSPGTDTLGTGRPRE
jgi:general secretion pathway protein G